MSSDVGRLPLPAVLDMIGGAACLIMPSVWYETFGLTIIEAYAKGTPVIASRLGAMAELVAEGKTGFLFAPGDSAALATAVERLLADPDALARMRPAARREFVEKYTTETNCRQLVAIYEQAIGIAARRGRRAGNSTVQSGATAGADTRCSSPGCPRRRGSTRFWQLGRNWPARSG